MGGRSLFVIVLVLASLATTRAAFSSCGDTVIDAAEEVGRSSEKHADAVPPEERVSRGLTVSFCLKRSFARIRHCVLS